MARRSTKIQEPENIVPQNQHNETVEIPKPVSLEEIERRMEERKKDGVK